jgi:hypothetical protein
MGIKIEMRDCAVRKHEKTFVQRGVRTAVGETQRGGLHGSSGDGAPCMPWRARPRPRVTVSGSISSIGIGIVNEGAQRAGACDEKHAGVFFRFKPFFVAQIRPPGHILERDAHYRSFRVFVKQRWRGGRGGTRA